MSRRWGRVGEYSNQLITFFNLILGMKNSTLEFLMSIFELRGQNYTGPAWFLIQSYNFKIWDDYAYRLYNHVKMILVPFAKAQPNLSKMEQYIANNEYEGRVQLYFFLIKFWMQLSTFIRKFPIASWDIVPKNPVFLTSDLFYCVSWYKEPVSNNLLYKL